MSKILLIIAFLGLSLSGFSQSVLPLRADTVRIEKIGGSAELHLRNATRDSLGVLTNIGNGRTRFLVPKRRGDTLFVGRDTIIGAPKVDTLYKDGDSIRYTINGRPYAVLGGTNFILYNALGGTGDTLVNADKEVKTLAVGYGINRAANGTTVTHTADTAELTTPYYVNSAKPWPAEEPIGLIYNKNYWPNQTDFTPQPSVSLSLNGGYVDYNVSTIDWGNYTRILPTRPTILPNWTIEVTFKMLTAPTTGTVGFGLGTKGIIGGADLLCYVNTTTSNSGLLNILKGDGSATYQTGSSATVNQNDIVKLTVAFVDSSITFTLNNLTTGGTGSISYTNTLISATSPISVLSNWALIGHSTVSCTWQVQAIKISSATKRNATLVVMGDSKTQGAFATYFGSRFGTRLNTPYPSSIVYASGNAKTSDFLNYMQEEMMNLNGYQYLLALGSNDKRFGSTETELRDAYTKLVKLLQGGGARVLHTVFPEDSTSAGVGLTAFKNWVAATYSGDYIDTWTQLSTSNILKAGYNSGDGVHLNEAANKSIDSLVVLSGKITARPANMRHPVLVTDGNIRVHGDSLSLFPIDKAENYVPHWDIIGGMRTGLLQDNNSTVGISLTKMVPVAGTQFTVTGFFGINGPGNGIIFGDRQRDLATGSTFAIYGDVGHLRVFSTPRAALAFQMDSLGRFGYSGAIDPQAWAHFPSNPGTAGGVPIKFQITSATDLTATPERGALEAKGNILTYTDTLLNRDTIAMRRWVRENVTLESGTYTPTITGVSNVAGTTLKGAHYRKNGNIIHVTVYLTIDPTAASSTEIAVSLPIASELGTDELFGNANCSDYRQSGIVTTDATNNRATFIFGAADTSAQDFVLMFSYQLTLP